MRRFTKILAGTVAAAAITAVSAAAGPAGVARATPQVEPAHTCSPGFLCVHLENPSGNYTWYEYYSCVKTPIPDDLRATWFQNNQTNGDKATFYYFGTSTVTWTTPKAPSKGPVPNMTGPLGYATAVKPC